jgi:hypothetical protein
MAKLRQIKPATLDRAMVRELRKMIRAVESGEVVSLAYAAVCRDGGLLTHEDSLHGQEYRSLAAVERLRWRMNKKLDGDSIFESFA